MLQTDGVKSSDATVKIALLALALNVIVGFVAYPVAFFFAYAFAENVTASMHAVFLVGVLITLIVATIALAPMVARILQVTPRDATPGSFLASAAVTLAFFACYFVVDTQQVLGNAVTSDFTTTNDLTLAIGCLAAAGVAVLLAMKALPEER